MLTEPCTSCGDVEVDVGISWPTSMGQMSGCFCRPCSEDWWAKYKSTTCGQGAIFSPVEVLLACPA